MSVQGLPPGPRTPSAVQGPPVAAGADTDTALTDWGFAPRDVENLKRAGAIA